MESFTYFTLIPMVYIAAAVFVIGIVYRLVTIFRAPTHPTTLQIYPEKRPKWLWALRDTFFFPTILRHKPVFWIFLMAFHICLVLLFIGHLELIAEFDVLQIIEHQIFLGGGFVGLIMLVALIYFLFRRFASPVREISVAEDYYLLILLFLTVLFGSQMDWARNWYYYDALGVDGYREYLYSLVTFKPELPYNIDAGHSFMLVVHVFFANLLLIVFPFTQLMHSILSLPINKLRRG